MYRRGSTSPSAASPAGEAIGEKGEMSRGGLPTLKGGGGVGGGGEVGGGGK